MTTNIPSELELLRRVASAAAWAIQANGDDPVGRDGRSRVGLNWVMANGELNGALKALAEHFAVGDFHADERAKAAEIEEQLRSVGSAKRSSAE
jgi:hypothetical protein